MLFRQFHQKTALPLCGKTLFLQSHLQLLLILPLLTLRIIGKVGTEVLPQDDGLPPPRKSHIPPRIRHISGVILSKAVFLSALGKVLTVIEVVLSTGLLVHRGGLLQLRLQLCLRKGEELSSPRKGRGRFIRGVREEGMRIEKGDGIGIYGISIESQSVGLFEIGRFLSSQDGELLVIYFFRPLGQCSDGRHLNLDGGVLRAQAQRIHTGFTDAHQRTATAMSHYISSNTPTHHPSPFPMTTYPRPPSILISNLYNSCNKYNPMENYDKVTLIHSSTDRKVYSAVSKKDGYAWILKMVRKTPSSTSPMLKEIALHQELAHDHVVLLKTSFPLTDQKTQYAVLVLEYCSGGSLDRLIPSDGVDLVGRVGWLVDAARGLEHLHHNLVVHGDVKPENVMLGRGRAKIGDLGMAKFVEEEGNEQGTRWYVAPEVLQGRTAGLEADVWSFGILCLEVITNCRINHLLVGHKHPAAREDFPSTDLLQKIPQEKLRTLVKKMLARRKDRRPTMIAIIEKLDKRLIHLRRNCGVESIQLDLPLEESGFDQGEALREWKNRLQPKKEKVKADKYKIKTKQGGDVIIKYDDYRQSMRVTFQDMEITYDYQKLPPPIKHHFPNLNELNACLRTSSTKVSFGTNGALVFPFLARLPYDPTHIRSRSNSRSNRSSVGAINGDREEEEDPSEKTEQSRIMKKFGKEEESVIQEEEENSSLGERRSDKSGSKSGKASYRFGEKQREERENDRETEPIEEEGADHDREPSQTTTTIPTTIPTTGINTPSPSQFAPVPRVVQQQEQQILEPSQNNPRNREPRSNSPTHPSEEPSIPHSFNPPPPQRGPHSRPQQSPLNPQAIKQLQSQISFLQQVQGPERVILPDQYMTLAYMHYKQKDKERSEFCLRKAIHHYDETHRYKSDQCAQAHYYLANILCKDEDEDWDGIPRRREEGPREQVEQRAIVGNEMQALGELQKAAQILNALRSYDSATFNKVYNAMGVIYLRANSLFLAREYFLNALDKIRDPTGRYEHRLAYRPTRNLGNLELKERRYAEARPYLEQALQLQPQFKLTAQLSLRNQLQECCLELKDYGGGLEHLQQGLALVKSLEGMKQLENFPAKLMAGMRQEFRRWIQLLLGDHSQGIVVHLKALHELLKTYFPGMDQGGMTLRSKIQMIQQSVR